MDSRTGTDFLPDDLKPVLQPGEYVFISLEDPDRVARADTLAEFKEAEGLTVVMTRQKADALKLTYAYIARWITLEAPTTLQDVGITAAFSGALARAGISCNVIAGYHHDHLFVSAKQATGAMAVLQGLAAGTA